MVRLTARRVTIYSAVGLYCLVLLHVRNSTQYLEDEERPPDFTEDDHTYLFFDAPPASAPRSRRVVLEEERRNSAAGRTARHEEEPRREKGEDTRGSRGGTPIRFHRAQAHQKNSTTPVTLTGKPGKTKVVTTRPSAAKLLTVTETTARPSSCDGCFQTDFPVLTDQPGVCREVVAAAAGSRGTASSSSSAAAVVDVVFLIVSARRNFAQRRAVRGTWASVTRNNTGNLRHVFVLGTGGAGAGAGADSKLSRAVEDEARRFGDVIVVGFRDSYRNLTLKVVSSLRWLSSRCQRARFFMKVDDDVWVNTPVVTSLLTANSDFLQHGLVGHCSHRWHPRRDTASKWYVPRHLYPGDTYPPYCQGMAYAGALTTAQRIVGQSVHVPYFPIEDVYVGMCLQRLPGFATRNVDGFSNYYGHDPCQGRSARVPTLHRVSAATMLELWAAADCSPES